MVIFKEKTIKRLNTFVALVPITYEDKLLLIVSFVAYPPQKLLNLTLGQVSIQIEYSLKTYT